MLYFDLPIYFSMIAQKSKWIFLAEGGDCKFFLSIIQAEKKKANQ